MTTYTLSNNQSQIIPTNPSGTDILHLIGTSATAVPVATFNSSDALVGINTSGTQLPNGTFQPGFGSINLMAGAVISTQTLSVDHATLSISERPSASATFNGVSNITNGSTLTATGYSGTGVYTVNGTMNIDGTSTVNMDYVKVQGSGTFHLSGTNPLLRLGNVTSGTTVKLDSGMLSLTNGMSFLGTITDSTPTSGAIGSSASVDVYNAMTAASETFHTSTGMLQLLDNAGNTVASLHFAGNGPLYATPTSGLSTNYIAISTHQSSGSLPMHLMS